MKKKVTLIDIAKVCNTSNVTVSKALAGKPGMSEELRDKIRKTAEEMGYKTNKSGAVRKKRNVGILIPSKFINPNGSFYWALYNYLVQRLKKENLYCILENLEQDDEDKLVLPNIVTDKKISGLISLGQISNEYLKKLHDNMKEILLLDYYTSELKVDSVVTNGYNGGYKLASYLIKMGHTKIGFIGSIKATTSIFDRYMGYVKAMIENDLPVNPEWTIEDRECGDFIAMDFPSELPTAFVCNCDEAAYHAIKQLRQKGYIAPKDISIVGYDNYLISEISEPKITTINVEAEKMADVAVNKLLSRMENPDEPCIMKTIEGDLVIKNSVLKIG